jgi:hypothetical protein
MQGLITEQAKKKFASDVRMQQKFIELAARV